MSFSNYLTILILKLQYRATEGRLFNTKSFHHEKKYPGFIIDKLF